MYVLALCVRAFIWTQSRLLASEASKPLSNHENLDQEYMRIYMYVKSSKVE